MNWQALLLTLRLSLVTASALLLIALPIAYWIAYSPRRWKFLAQAATALPLVMPPTVLGFYVLVAFGSSSPLGRLYQHWTGHTLAFTFEGLVVGSILYSMPFAVQPLVNSFLAVDPQLIQASRVLGASRLSTFFRVVLPLSISGVATAVALTFAHTFGEFGVVLMVGGDIPGLTRTISIDVFDKVEAGSYAAANSTSLVLLAVSFVILALVYAWNRRAWPRTPWA
ncbi:MAG TPA: molybdate ABC transporter permease subunit [Candidatus Dormibacteraeota bacterium]|nr:molybdate ABC transporter permease subunit [Candidatus Dormibacteraeota bacterium]